MEGITGIWRESDRGVAFFLRKGILLLKSLDFGEIWMMGRKSKEMLKEFHFSLANVVFPR